jgi:F-type H+-transporting ATPase subunit a
VAAIKKVWARIGKKGRIAVIFIVCIVVIVAGIKLAYIHNPPHVELAPEALWSIGGHATDVNGVHQELSKVTGFPITNTMIGAWITILVIGLLGFLATRKMKLVPTGLQNAVEALIETLINFVNGVAGEKNGRKFFPMFAIIFLFVFLNAWLSLIPGFGTIGFKEVLDGKEILIPLFRGANTDVNVPLAIALVSFVFVEYWGLRSQGFRYLKKFFSMGTLGKSLKLIFSGKKSGFGMLFNGVIEAFIGLIETLSELIRIVSFTFRLFGNMTAGEILLGSMMFLIPWVVALPFYGLELFVGIIQALIFAGLTLVFVVMAVTPHGEHEEHAEHAAH